MNSHKIQSTKISRLTLVLGSVSRSELFGKPFPLAAAGEMLIFSHSHTTVV